MRSEGYKCYNTKCSCCIGGKRCGEPFDIALGCDSRMVRRKTNADHIRSMTDEELAKRNIRKIKTPVTGYYDYGESYTDYYDAWETSDGAIFWTEKPAVEYELHWLKQPKEET